MQVRQDTWAAGTLGVDATSPAGVVTLDGSIAYSGTYTISAIEGTNLRRVVTQITWDEHAP